MIGPGEVTFTSTAITSISGAVTAIPMHATDTLTARRAHSLATRLRGRVASRALYRSDSGDWGEGSHAADRICRGCIPTGRRAVVEMLNACVLAPGGGWCHFSGTSPSLQGSFTYEREVHGIPYLVVLQRDMD